VTEEGGKALAKKLDKLVSRVTKADVAQLLTPLRLHVVQESPVVDAKTALLTHNRARVRELASELGDCLFVTGELTPKKRDKVVQEWRELGVPLVATMHSITEGIDLTHANRVIFDQLYYRPATVVQTIGRFHRLNQKEPVDIYFVVRPGSLEERIALILANKFNAMQQTGNASSTDDAVLNTLDAYMDKSDEDVLAAIMNSAPKKAEDYALLLNFADDSDE
jgi:superfamily II DNA or RNA helicase